MLLDWVSLKHVSGRSIVLETTDAQVTLKLKGKISEEQTVLLTNSYLLQEKLPKSEIYLKSLESYGHHLVAQLRGYLAIIHPGRAKMLSG